MSVKFSIINKCHNAPKHEALFLDTLFAHSVYEHELIVVAGDPTEEVLDVVRSRGIEPVIVHGLGPYGANDEGIRHATCDWICLADDDTVLSPGWDRRMAELIDNEFDMPGCFQIRSADGPFTASWASTCMMELGATPDEFDVGLFCEICAQLAEGHEGEEKPDGFFLPLIFSKRLYDLAGPFKRDTRDYPEPLDQEFLIRCREVGARRRIAQDAYCYHFGEASGLIKKE